MSAVLEARAVITAEDKTGKAFDSLKARIAAISKQCETLDRAMATVGPVAKNVEAVAIPAERASAALARMAEAGRSVGSVASAIASVERASAGMAASVGRSSKEVQKLSTELSEAKGKLTAISDFKGSNRAVKEATLALRQARQVERELAAKLDGVANPARSMQAAHLSALSEVRATEKALQAQVTAASAARTALGGLGVPINRLAEEEARLAASAETVTRALEKQAAIERDVASAALRTAAAEQRASDVAAHAADKAARAHAKEAAAREAEIRHHGAMNFLAMGAAGAVSAHSVFEGIAETAHAGAEYHHEIVGLQNAGRTPEEIEAIEKRSAEVVGKLPTASYLENMKVIAETTGAFGSVEHAMDHLEFMQRTMSVLKASGGEHIKGGVGDVGRALAKTFEERMTKPEEFEREAAAMIPAMVASGGTFNPEQLYAFAQQAKSALPNYDLRFLSKIAPSLIGANGGDRAGTAANAFNSIIMGKVNDKKQAEAWQRFGLLSTDPKQVIMKAGHTVGWNAGAVKDTDLALRDPLEWAEKVVLPAMRDKGVDVDNRLELAKVLGTMFRNQNGNMFANEIMQAASRARLHKDEALFGRVGTAEEIYDRNKSDPTVQLQALKASLENLMVTLANPLMGRAGLTMNTVASGLDSLANTMREHPALAASAGVMAAGGSLAGAGYLSYQFMNGFGLGTSATALEAAAAEQTGAAGALSAAAARLGAAGVEHGIEGAIPGAAGRAGRTAERVIVREVEHAGEGVTEAAIGGKIVSAIEGGLKGGLSVAALEVAATAGVTLTAGTVAFLGLSAAAIIAGLIASTPKKHHASDDPHFGDPLAPHPLDLTNPNLPHDLDEQKKPWFNRNSGAHPRGTVGSQHDTDLPGHWVDGPHGTRHWALEAPPKVLKDAPFYATTMGPDGRLPGMPALGLKPDLSDRSTWARIDPTMAAPDEVFQPRVPPPLPPVRPREFDGIAPPPRAFYDQRTKDDVTPLPHGGGPVPVSIVSLPLAAHDGWLDGERPAIEERARRGAAMFRQDHEGTVGQRMMDHEQQDSALHVDASEVETAATKVKEVQQGMAALNGTTAGLNINMGQVDEAIRKLTQLRSLAAGAGGGGTSGALGTSYPQTAPTGRQGGPR